MVALFDLHRVAQRARGARHNGDLLYRGGVRLHRRHERVAVHVVGDDLLLLVGHDGVLLLVAGDDDLDALFQVCLRGKASAVAHGAQRCFVHDVGKLRAGSAGGHARDLVEVDVLGDLDLLRVDLQDSLASLEVGQLHRHAAVEAARARERGVEGFGAVRGGENDLLGLLEEVAHLARAHADEHFDKFRAGHREERHIRLAGDRLGEHRFTGSRRADEQNALGH